jgi:integrase
MARGTSKLSAVAVAKAKKPGRYADGNGLYLQVGPTGTKSWLFRYMINGRAREMGLGPVSLIPLAEARVAALETRRKVHEGIDPLAEREEQQRQARIEQARAMTFSQCADAYIQAHRSSWRNDKHAAQWESTLKSYAAPIIGDLPVDAVDLRLVLAILEPIWRDKPETASRLRGRLETVLDWAAVRGLRQGDNPARWRGHLDKLLPARAKVKRVEHHAALPYAEIGAFMAKLRTREGIGSLALEFTILTAARTSEVLNATWGEIDRDAAAWTVPGARMKAGREHRVPLSPRALAILTELGGGGDMEFVFPGNRAGKPLSNMVFLQLLKRMGYADLTAHGFRSTFRDWAAEQTAFPREVAEAALAHVVADKVEAAYRRGDLFEKRRQLMEAWASWCGAIGTKHCAE